MYILLLIFSIVPTFFINSYFDYIGWYVTLYIIAAYLRLYPCKWVNSRKFCLYGLVISIIISILSVITIYFVSIRLQKQLPYYYFLKDSNKILALITSLFVFLFFKNLTIRHNRIINIISSTVFGILCIHSASDTMRNFLWNDIFHTSHHLQNDNTVHFIFYSFFCTILVFITCIIIDLFRQFVFKIIKKNKNLYIGD